MQRRNQRLKTFVIVSVAILVILAGTLVGAVRLVDLVAPGYRSDLAGWVSDRIERPLTIGALDMTWHFSGPVLELRDVALLDAAGVQPMLGLDAIALHFDFVDLVRGRLEPGGIALVGLELTAYRDAEGNIGLRGMQDATSGSGFDFASFKRRLDTLRTFRLRDSRLRWQTADQPDLLFSKLALTLRQGDQSYDVRASAQLPPALGGSIQAQARIGNRARKINQIDADLALQAEAISAAGWGARYGLIGTTVEAGTTDFTASAQWRNGKLTEAQAALDTAAFQTGPAANPTILQPPLTVSLRLQAADTNYRLVLETLGIDDSPVTGARGEWLIDPDRRSLRGAIRQLPADLLVGGLRLADPERWQAWQADGSFEKIEMHYTASNEYQLTGSTANLALTAPKLDYAGPSMAAEFMVAPDGGQLSILSGKGQLAAGRYLQGSLPIDELSGTIGWQTQPQGLQINTENLHWTGLQSALDGAGSLRLPDAGPPFIDFKFSLRTQAIQGLLARIPQQQALPNPRLREWLPKAIRHGRIIESSIQLQGPADRFPFAGDSGIFRVEASVRDADLAYKPGWPPLSNIDGRFTLDGDNLRVDARRGDMLDVRIGPATASIENVREPILKVDGQVNGASSARMLAFLDNSPLKQKFGRLEQAIDVDGPGNLELDLSIPLKPDLGDIQVDGLIDLNAVRLSHRVLPEPIQDIRGQLRFDLKGLYAKGLSGRLKTLPLTVDLQPGTDNALAITALADVELPRDQSILSSFAPDSIIARAKGRTQWQAELVVNPTGKVSDLSLRSTLTGLALRLPAPLGKPAQTQAPTRIEVAADRSRVRLAYGERLRMHLRSSNGNLQAAEFIFGNDPIDPPAGPGIWLGGGMAVCNLTEWRALLDEFSGNGSKPPGLRGANLEIGKLRALGQQLADVTLWVTPLTADDGWQANLTGPNVQGDLRWVERSGIRPQLSAVFERADIVTLPPAKSSPPATSANNAPFDPGGLPAIEVQVHNLGIDERDFGRFDLSAVTIPNGIRIQRAAATGGLLDLNASGHWIREADATRGLLTTDISGSGIKNALLALGYTPNITAESLNIRSELRVTPNPRGLSPETLNGRLSLSMREGALLNIEPGAGRVLGLLNFYSLPRRLFLDFRDVLDEGLAFDTLEGDFIITNGNAFTDNLRIINPASEIRINGRVGLAARDYDQQITIVPQVSSGVTIAGTVLGGPAVGAALLLAQQLLKKPIEAMSKVTYQLEGSWGDPQIAEVRSQADER